MKSHDLIDQRSLVFGKLIAERILVDRNGIDHARKNVERWLLTCSPGTRSTLIEWQAMIDGPLEGLVAVLTGDDERAKRLRQSNPFTGIISEQERHEIIRRFYAYESGTA